MNDTPFQDFPPYVQQSKGKPKFLVLFLIVFVLVLAILAGLYFLGGASKKSIDKVMPVPTSAIVLPSPTPASPSASVSILPSGKITPTSKIGPTGVSSSTQRSELKVAVHNGSGVVGAAQKTSSYLKELGYNVVSTGNADGYSYTGITIKVRKNKSAYLAMLKKDLPPIASKGATIVGSIDDTIATDAEVIVGK